MKYVALLRGINVGGNNSVSMATLKELFAENGYTNIITYINSGNVIFESVETDTKKLTTHIEALLSKAFNYQARVVIKSYEQIKAITHDIPSEWKTSTQIRCYVGFLSEFVTEDMISEVTIREGVDSLKAGKGVLYMTTLLSHLTKSNFNKLMTKKIYKEMTIRNYNTTKKILELMEKKIT